MHTQIKSRPALRLGDMQQQHQYIMEGLAGVVKEYNASVALCHCSSGPRSSVPALSKSEFNGVHLETRIS